MRGRIEFRDVSFAYPRRDNGHPVVADVSFTVEPGQKLAIVGRTGSGKSSLVQLLPRLFDVSDGAVLLDGRDVRRVPLAQLRGAIGFVPQDPFLFSTSIRDNIAFGVDPPAADVDGIVRRAAEVAGVAADLDAFPHGYDTVVGERGITLSGGQKQRLTLARAVACEPHVLVLDDALSSVDTRTETRHPATGCAASWPAARASSSRTASRPCWTPTTSPCSTKAASSSSATTPRCWRSDGLYADLFRQQQLEEELEAL